MQTMKNIMSKIKGEKIEQIADAKVLATSNYDSSVKTYSTGNCETIDLPKTNAVKFHLESGDWVCVRPSGTEPKLKIYVATKADCKSAAEQTAESYLVAMKELLK